MTGFLGWHDSCLFSHIPIALPDTYKLFMNTSTILEAWFLPISRDIWWGIVPYCDHIRGLYIYCFHSIQLAQILFERSCVILHQIALSKETYDKTKVESHKKAKQRVENCCKSKPEDRHYWKFQDQEILMINIFTT